MFQILPPLEPPTLSDKPLQKKQMNPDTFSSFFYIALLCPMIHELRWLPMPGVNLGFKKK